VFSQSHWDCAQATGEIAGATRGDELGPLMAAAGQGSRSPADAGGDLRLIHRGVWDEGLAGGQGAAGRVRV